MKFTFQKEQQLNCNIGKAWKFFSSPENLSTITPSYLNFKILTQLNNPHIYSGMIIDYKVSPLLNIPMHWRTQITEVDFEKKFKDIQLKGPYKTWEHTHEFVPNLHGVNMIDYVIYELPFGKLGNCMNSLVVKKKLDEIFNYRTTIINNIFNIKQI